MTGGVPAIGMTPTAASTACPHSPTPQQLQAGPDGCPADALPWL